MPALCLILNSDYYANNYAGIFDASQMVCQQHVLTASRSPKLTNGRKEKISLHHLDLNHRPLDFQSSSTLTHHLGGIDIFAFIYLHIIYY